MRSAMPTVLLFVLVVPGKVVVLFPKGKTIKLGTEVTKSTPLNENIKKGLGLALPDAAQEHSIRTV